MPLVSVVVSAYERPAMLRAALDSLLSQTHTDLEILVQDDSPTESCEAVVNELQDGRIRYERNRPSLGTMANLRAGYRKATGKYVSTLNDDDLYDPVYLATMVAGLEDHPECSLAFADHWIIKDDGQVDTVATDHNSAAFGRNLLAAGVISDVVTPAFVHKSIPGMFAVYRSEWMDWSDFPDDVSSGYDFWLTYLAVRDGRPAFYSPQRLTSYRVHEGSQTHAFTDPEKRLRSLAYDLYMTTRMRDDGRLALVRTTLEERMASINVSMGNALLQTGNRAEAQRSFRVALQLCPGNRARVGLFLALLPSVISQRLLRARAGL